MLCWDMTLLSVWEVRSAKKPGLLGSRSCLMLLVAACCPTHALGQQQSLEVSNQSLSQPPRTHCTHWCSRLLADPS